jgi:hypothetical protein
LQLIVDQAGADLEHSTVLSVNIIKVGQSENEIAYRTTHQAYDLASTSISQHLTTQTLTANARFSNFTPVHYQQFQ